MACDPLGGMWWAHPRSSSRKSSLSCLHQICCLDSRNQTLSSIDCIGLHYCCTARWRECRLEGLPIWPTRSPLHQRRRRLQKDMEGAHRRPPQYPTSWWPSPGAMLIWYNFGLLYNCTLLIRKWIGASACAFQTPTAVKKRLIAVDLMTLISMMPSAARCLNSTNRYLFADQMQV